MTGAPKPLLAIVGAAGSPPAAMGVPQGLTLEVPGAGPLTTRRVASLPGDGLQVALSNVVGAWAAHYAVTDLEHLAIARGSRRRVASSNCPRRSRWERTSSGPATSG